MTCDKARGRLPDLCAGDLDLRAEAEVQAHLDGCAACRRAADELVGTISLLRRAGEEEAPPGFSAALHKRLAAEGPPPRRASFLTRLSEWMSWKPLGYALAGAAAALLIVGLIRWRERPRGTEIAKGETGEVRPTFHIPAAKLAVVKIDFVAEVAVEDVEFAVELPEGLHFVSGGKELPEREFAWRGRLEQGSNLIPIAVRGRRPGRYTVQARASGGGVDAIHQVVLEVTSG